MAYVNFPTSGSFFLRDSTDGSLASGSLLIINEELGLNRVVASGLTTSGYFDYTIPDAHTSKDLYTVIPFGYGYVGEAYSQAGFSPTVEVIRETYQSVTQVVSGTPIIDSRGFEDFTLSGFNVSVTGSSISASGIINAASMEGSYYIRLNTSSSTGGLFMTPSDPTSSGLASGRMIMLTRNATSNGSQFNTGFAFWRQGNGLTDQAYKIYLSVPSNTTYRLNCRTGPLAGTDGIIDTAGSLLWSEDFTFSATGARNARRNIWLMVEWEQQTNGMAYSVYYKFHEAGDTIADVKNKALLLRQQVYYGNASETNYFTTASGSPCWFLSTNQVEVGMDMFHLESIPALPSVGIYNLNLLERNRAVGPTEGRPQIANIRLADSVAPPEGFPNFAGTTNPTVTAAESWIGQAGYNFLGLQVSYSVGSDVGDNIYNLFTFKEPTSSGITHGVFRAALLNGAVADAKFGFSFLRQGSAHNSNCYTVEKFRNGTNDHRFRIRKGACFSTTLDDNANIIGTTLATSSSLSISDNTTVWMEVRWKADSNAGSTFIEVLYNLNVTQDETSPGVLDYNLTQALTHNDFSAPYLTTSESPMLICMAEGSVFRMYKHELRRARS
jgi:hypothetical protein